MVKAILTFVRLTIVSPRGAGSDTTATALSGWMYLMLTNEMAYRKLVTEIRDEFKSEKDITWNRVKDLPYLGACISEAMRMIPPVPGNLNRVVPPEGAFIDGKWVMGEVRLRVFLPIF
jgi:cytochrome P450